MTIGLKSASFMFAALTVLSANAAETTKEKLRNMFSVEDVEIISVSKTPESAFEAASAVYVIKQSDIKRSGATNIPEALRLAPGLEVARIDSNKWAITSRGFNRQFVNKMLVLIDGRSVYTPLFSGIYWDTQDTVLEDIDRIEVVRGPGATLWGANAVNGVINIITKDSRVTQGNLVSVIGGNEEQGNVSVRHGGKVGDNLSYRVFSKYYKRGESLTSTGIDANDESEMSRGGFKIDWEKNVKNQITFQGDIYEGYNEQPLTLPSIASPVIGDEEVRGGNLMAKWKHIKSNESVFDFQLYLDYIKRDISVLEQERRTVDFDFQHNWKKLEDHEITWGLGYRFFWDNLRTPPINGTQYLDYNPDKSYNHLYSGFVQDKISLIPEKLFLTLGSKFEHNFYTDFEFQPNARISWIPNDKNTLWAAISRATRTPSRAERGISSVAGGTAPNFIRQVGNTGMESEELLAYEVGYRVKPKENLSLDMTVFHNDYDNLRSFEPNGSLNVPSSNKGYAESYGVELASEWRVNGMWSLIASYSYFTLNMHVDSDSTDNITESGDEKASPHNQAKLRSHLNLTDNIDFDNMLYYVDNVSSKNIDSYIRVDTRLAWRPSDKVEFSVVGQNLFDDSHPEFSQSLYSTRSEIGRSVYGKVSIEF